MVNPLLIDIFASNFQGWSAYTRGTSPQIFMQIGQNWNFSLSWLIVHVRIILNVSCSRGVWKYGHQTRNFNSISKISRRYSQTPTYSVNGPRLAQNFTVTANSNKSHVACHQEEGQINLLQKLEINISKNGRDIAQFLPKKLNVHIMILSYCVLC